MSLQKNIIKNCKNLIDSNNLKDLENYYKELFDKKIDYNINVEYIFKNVYLYAIIKQNKEIILWLINIYNSFDDIIKIALKHTFTYSKYLLMTKNNIEFIFWYKNSILSTLFIY